jgi:death on curing protein
MISVKNAVRIHNILIDKFGGETGLRDRKLLESALTRPYQTFDKKELHKSPIEKAASLIESLINNHPFIDGNKRFGYVAMRLTLLEYGIDINATENDKYDFVISIAKGDLKFAEICSWIKSKQK